MSETPHNPSPGFYPDGQGAHRYWDGMAWTDETQAVPDSAPPSASQISGTAVSGTVGDNGTSRPWFKMKRWWLAAFVVVLVVGAAASGSEDDASVDSKTAVAEPEPKKETAAADEPAVDAQPELEPTATTAQPEPKIEKTPDLTAAQQNAVRAAENYLDMAAFSRTGLIKQLEYEKYSSADATFAVDAIDADWNEQAAKAAKNYLDMTAFSRSGLVDQLKYEGYSNEQAEYGVSKTGL